MLKSLSIALCNWRVLIKSLLMQALTFALIAALMFVLFGSLFAQAVEMFDGAGLSEFLSDTVKSIMDGTFNSEVFTAQLNTTIKNVQAGIASLSGNFVGGVELAYVLAVVVLFAYRVLVSLTDVATSCCIQDFMTSNSSKPFMWFFFKKQGKAWKFALLQAAYALPLDALILFGAIGLYLLFLVAFGWWTIIPAIIIGLVLYTLRQTLFAFCLPSVVCNDQMNTSKAFGVGISKLIPHFWNLFWRNLVVMLVIGAISLLTALYMKTPWLIAIVFTVPNFLLFFYIKCINMLEYFKATDQPYFHKVVAIEGTDRYNKKHKNDQQNV